MQRRDLERRLAERLEPEPKGSDYGASSYGLWFRAWGESKGNLVVSPWIPAEFCHAPLSMHALIGTAENRVGMRVSIAPTHRTETSPWEGLYIVGAKQNGGEWHWAPPVALDSWPLAVAIAIARALGILSEEEGVDDE